MRVGASVLRYRGGTGQWAWAIHRVAGLGVLLFLFLHIVDIFVAAFGPGLFNDLLFLYKGPPARFGEILLAFGLLYHALNGLRITAADFIPTLASLKTARRLYYFQLLLFAALFIPASYFMMVTLPQDPFKNNAAIAILTTGAILAIPLVLAVGAQLLPPAFGATGSVSGGSQSDSFERIVRGSAGRPRSEFEFNMWLFMRLSGILLLVLALFHMYYLHFVISVEQITFNTLVQRWNDPANPLLSLFWRVYDLALLTFAFTHGVNGARMVFDDYIQGHGFKQLVMLGLAGLFGIVMLMGIWIIFFFNGTLA